MREENAPLNDSVKSTFEEELNRTGVIVFTNVGVSMMPLLRQRRDLMVIRKKQAPCRKYDAVLFKRKNGQYILHRILKVRAQDYLICGDNCWQMESVAEEQILGVLTEVVRDGKTVKVDDWRYLLYVHLWCDLFPIRWVILRGKGFAWRIASKIKRTLRKGR